MAISTARLASPGYTASASLNADTNNQGAAVGLAMIAPGMGFALGPLSPAPAKLNPPFLNLKKMTMSKRWRGVVYPMKTGTAALVAQSCVVPEHRSNWKLPNFMGSTELVGTSQKHLGSAQRSKAKFL